MRRTSLPRNDGGVTMSGPSDAPHLPRSAPIEAYGKGGFAFADMSHRGSLLCLPDAIWAWPVTRPDEIDETSLARVFAAANCIDTLIVGDSLADLLCARQIGCKFAAVLTGLSGKKARAELEARGADFVLDAVAEIGKLVEALNAR